MLNSYIRFHKNKQADFIIKALIATGLLLLLGPVVLNVKGTMPITLQSLVVLLGSIAYGWRIGIISILIYIISGALGLPVFAGYNSGVDALLGPFGGFFFGFIAAVIICGFLAEKASFQKAIPAMMIWLLGHGIILLLGIVWLSAFDPEGWYVKLKSLIPGALIKSVVGALIIQIVIRFYTKEKREAFEE